MFLVEYLFLTSALLGVVFFIIRRHGMASVEGYCATFLGLAIVGDTVNLLVDYFFQPGTLLLGPDEFTFRLYPGFVHILALLALLAGLFLTNPKPAPIGRGFSGPELNFAAYTGAALVLIGLSMSLVAIVLTHAFSAANFFHGLDTFRAGQAGEAGGFWYRGADIADFGFALILPSRRKSSRFFLVLGAMFAVSFFLRANKGGFETPILWAALGLYTYNPRRFWSFAKLRVAVCCLAAILIGIGIKVDLLMNGPSSQSMTVSMFGPIQNRWGDQGLYRGWCQFINLLPKYHYLFQGHPEGVFAVTAWVPKFITGTRADLPGQGLGFMVHADAHTYKGESPSLGLVGSVYADDKLFSTIAYMLIIGIFLGFLRRYAAGLRSPMQWRISYLAFALFGGLSAEAGISDLLYTFFLTFAATGLAHLIVVGLFKRKLHSAARQLPYVLPEDFPIRRLPA
ncbi:MAG TPA: hypothetical protein VHU83_21895 [Bryobacteraceae bacterium]|jgi:hypothetical protein|nr:hypothetical protein [Bryobacteraceae bacterium]